MISDAGSGCDGVLRVHSLGEAYMFVSISVCSTCNQGSCICVERRPRPLIDPPILDMIVRCEQCGARRAWSFQLPAVPATGGDPAAQRINPTSQPSKVIDPVQWVSLFKAILAAAERECDKSESRRLGYEAAQCLEEALKFYDDDNDLPSTAGITNDASLARLREHPQRYSRERLVSMRARLPDLKVMERRLQAVSNAASPTGARRRAWWKFWR